VGEGLDLNWIALLRRLAPLLPTALFDQLQNSPYTPADGGTDTQAEQMLAARLHEAIAALDSLRHTLTQFLPRYLLDRAPEPGQPQGELLKGSFIFADVTGFTALTGELSKRGTEGREEMNRLMQALFATLLEPLLTSGGDLLIFAGDAALACFPAQPNGQDARWAARTALRLVRAIEPFAHFETPYGPFSLTMSAGIERGEAFAAIVGTRRRMELLVSGGPVQGATKAEGEANPGQVVAAPGILQFLDADEFRLRKNVVEPTRGDTLGEYETPPPIRRRGRLSAIFSRRLPDLLQQLQQTLTEVERLVPFIPADLFTQIISGEDVRQHPPVAVQFVNLQGVEDLALGPAGPDLATAVLQRYFVQAQEIVGEREGIVSQVDPYASGFTLLNPFGAPTHHEGVPRLAASAALELGRALERINQEYALNTPLTQRIGLTYDRIFTGEIGYRHRREYVVAGPAVNLAARLMSKAEAGQIVLDPATWEAVQRDFLSTALPPIPLKGIPEPVPRYALRRIRRGRGLHLADYPLIGRDREWDLLQRYYSEALAGQGRAVALLGDTGAGKSRLVTALTEFAAEQGTTVLYGRCRPFGQTTPFLPWAEMIAQWFELDDEAPAPARREQLRERLAKFDMPASFPAFASLLGFPPPRPVAAERKRATRSGPGLFATLKQQATQEPADTTQGFAALLTQRTRRAEEAQGDTQGRSVWQILQERASIPHAVRMLLERQARREPTLLVIEDLQWMDADSREILEAASEVAEQHPLFLLVTARPPADWDREEIFLAPLSGAESQALAAFALRATGLTPDLGIWLEARTEGNPLFILSYCRALRDAEAVVVEPATHQARWSGLPPTLPVSLQELLLAQVSRAGRQTSEAIRRATIAGPTFSTSLLHSLCHNVLSMAQLDSALDQAARQSLIAPPPPASRHLFGSQSLYDAVYGALSHAARRTWHEQAGDYLTETDEETRYERLEQIAFHYSRGGHPYKAARFSRLAGDKARLREADEAALTFYEQTLAVAGGAEVKSEQSKAREGIGDVLALRGENEAASTAYRAALEQAPQECAARLQAKLALTTPLSDQPDLDRLAAAAEGLPPDSPLRPWLDAAQVWLRSEQDRKESIPACRALLAQADGPTRTILQEALDCLEGEKPLPPYTDFFSLFAHSSLRLPSGGAI